VGHDRPPEAGNAERFFGDDAVARGLYERVRAVVERLGDAEVRAGRSQIAFRRRRPFAAVWIPGRYLRGAVAPLVLTVYLPARDASPRWKEVVEPAAGRFTHHLELRRPDDVDEEVAAWLRQAWEAAA
jgi:hypothetical protein